MREKITVLIADDNQEFSMTLATYLKNQEDNWESKRWK